MATQTVASGALAGYFYDDVPGDWVQPGGTVLDTPPVPPSGSTWYYLVVTPGQDPTNWPGLGYVIQNAAGGKTYNPSNGLVPSGDLFCVSNTTVLPPMSAQVTPEGPPPVTITDPNPPASQPDTTVNGGSDFTGGAGRAYTPPNDTQYVASDKDTTPQGQFGTDANLNGPDSSRTVTAPQTSGTDGRSASGAVTDTGLHGTVDTNQYGPPGSSSSAAYRAPVEQPPISIYDSTKTDLVPGEVGNDNLPNSVPSGYAVTLRDTTGVGTRQGGPVTFTPPGAPTNVVASPVAGRRKVHLTWEAGSEPVGAPVKRWVVEGSTSGTKYVPGDARSAEIEDGLVGGQTYHFTVYAETDLGTGYRSAPSNDVIVSNGDLVVDTTFREEDEHTFAAVPDVPTSVTATGGVLSATVNWVAPTIDGGSPVSGYEVTSSHGEVKTVGNVLTTNFTGLTATAQTFTVKAINVTGKSAASAASNSVTPTAT